MFSTSGYIEENTVKTSDYTLKQYNGRKVIITVLDENIDLSSQNVSDEKLFKLSNTLISKNKKAYKELAKWLSLQRSK